MKKLTFGPQTIDYPLPVFLLGASVQGKPNFMTVAWGNIANSEPPMFGVAIRHTHYTCHGIQENRTFSVNLPSTHLVKEADYCGIVSGANENKVVACNFRIFYGKLETAPLIEECPVNVECEVVHELKLGSHILFIARIEETHFSDECLTDGHPDIHKIKPIVYNRSGIKTYHRVGEMLAPAFSIGRQVEASQGKEAP
jgi:flavin reductase (DIM6/NTAB) family NADH-FMN oxidoreductase RutF